MNPVVCAWCRRSTLKTRHAKYCDKRCRQSAFRQREAFQIESGVVQGPASAMRFAYADPPYPGFAKKCYGQHPDFNRFLIEWLQDQKFDGWALSTSVAALRDILPLCPSTVRVCAWVKPIGVSSATRGLHNTWEPVIVQSGRRRRPGMRDFLSAQPARLGGSSLIGRKPIAFCGFLFNALGMLPGDSLIDMFPGSGAVARSWSALGGVVDACRTPWSRAGTRKTRRPVMT